MLTVDCEPHSVMAQDDPQVPRDGRGFSGKDDGMVTTERDGYDFEDWCYIVVDHERLTVFDDWGVLSAVWCVDGGGQALPGADPMAHGFVPVGAIRRSVCPYRGVRLASAELWSAEQLAETVEQGRDDVTTEQYVEVRAVVSELATARAVCAADHATAA